MPTRHRLNCTAEVLVCDLGAESSDRPLPEQLGLLGLELVRGAATRDG